MSRIVILVKWPKPVIRTTDPRVPTFYVDQRTDPSTNNQIVSGQRVSIFTRTIIFPRLAVEIQERLYCSITIRNIRLSDAYERYWYYVKLLTTLSQNSTSSFFRCGCECGRGLRLSSSLLVGLVGGGGWGGILGGRLRCIDGLLWKRSRRCLDRGGGFRRIAPKGKSDVVVDDVWYLRRRSNSMWDVGCDRNRDTVVWLNGRGRRCRKSGGCVDLYIVVRLDRGLRTCILIETFNLGLVFTVVNDEIVAGGGCRTENSNAELSDDPLVQTVLAALGVFEVLGNRLLVRCK